MCGIAGFIDLTKSSDISLLKKMTDRLVHRGPDDAGYEIFNDGIANVGLGHRRLSIIDLSPLGHQPMFSDDKNYAIVFNGEVYNYKEIQIELEQYGFKFKSQSDTEVILKSYIKWGKEAVNKFIGMFSFVIYDRIKQKIIAFRDRAGVKPFYYYSKNDLFLFASEIKAFHQHPGFEKEINENVLNTYLKHGYIPEPDSIFQNTYKLSPGHTLTYNLKNKDFCIEKYWDVIDHYNLPKLNISEAEAIAQLDEILKSAFNYRMVSDVPVGVFLSGGYDSSLVTAILQKTRNETIKTFTIGFNEKGYNEANEAKKIAQYLGTKHTEYYCTTKEALDIIPELPEFYDEPFGDSSAIPTTLVSKMARQHVTVSLSADGGDEQFGGYTRYPYTQRVSGFRKKFPNFIAHALGNVQNLYTPKLFNYYPSFAKKFFLLQDVLKTKKDIDLLSVTSRYFYQKETEFLLKPEFNILNNAKYAHLLNEHNDLLSKLFAYDYKTYMVDDILTKVDRATMSVSLEGREPLLDHRIIEFAAQLPLSFKIQNNTLKYLLRKLTHKYIPSELIDRPKMGFGVPLAKWLNSELKELADHYLNEKRLKDGGIFNPKNVIRLKRNCLATEERDTRVWFILFFEMWRDKWM